MNFAALVLNPNSVPTYMVGQVYDGHPQVHHHEVYPNLVHGCCTWNYKWSMACTMEPLVVVAEMTTTSAARDMMSHNTILVALVVGSRPANSIHTTVLGMVVAVAVAAVTVVAVAVAAVHAVAGGMYDIADMCHMMSDDMVVAVVHTKNDWTLLAVLLLGQHSFANLYRQRNCEMTQRIHESWEVEVMRMSAAPQ